MLSASGGIAIAQGIHYQNGWGEKFRRDPSLASQPDISYLTVLADVNCINHMGDTSHSGEEWQLSAAAFTKFFSNLNNFCAELMPSIPATPRPY